MLASRTTPRAHLAALGAAALTLTGVQLFAAPAADAAPNVASAAPALAVAPPPRPQITVDDPWVPERNSATSAMTFHVRLSQAASDPVTVMVKTTDGTAHAPGDYTAVPLTALTFAPGQVDKAVPVTTLGDTQREGNETLRLTLSGPSANAILTDTSGQGTLYDADLQRHISVSDLYVVEPDDGGDVFVGFLVSLDAVPTADDPAGVDFTLVPGTASSGSDWEAGEPSGFVNLDDESGGQVQVVIRVIGDTLAETNETLTIKLSNPEGAVISDALGVGTILNDDDATTPDPVPRQISVTDPQVLEPDSGTVQARFKVTLDAPATAPVTVKAVTGGGTATAGGDYTALATQTVTFNPGQRTMNVDVAVLGDTLNEGNETFQLKLSKPTGAVLSDSAGLASIVDDEGPIVAYVDDVEVTEGDTNAPGPPAVFTVRLTALPTSANPVVLTVGNDDGTAKRVVIGGDQALWDYSAFTYQPQAFTSLTRTWSSGIWGNNAAEPRETFSLNLKSPVGVVIGDAKGIATIYDND